VLGEKRQSSKGETTAVGSAKKIWTVDSCPGARGLNPCKQSESPEGESYQEFSVWSSEFGGREFRPSTSEIMKGRIRSEPSICGRTCVIESSVSEIRAPGLTEVNTLTSRVAKS
jgi:hypothetical protein